MSLKIKTEHSTGRQIVTFGNKKALIRDEWVLICTFDEFKKVWTPKTYDIQAILEHFISTEEDLLPCEVPLRGGQLF